MQKNAYPVAEQDQTGISLVSSHMNVPADSIDVWEIDAHQLLFERKIATGSSGDLWVLVIVRPVICSHTSAFLIEWFNWNRYKGTFCSQDVAIKVLRGEHLDDKLQGEFVQEVSIMRSVIFLVLYWFDPSECLQRCSLKFWKHLQLQLELTNIPVESCLYTGTISKCKLTRLIILTVQKI